MENKYGKIRGKKTLIIKPSINDFEKYYSDKMKKLDVDVYDYLKPTINYENTHIKILFKIIRRIDKYLPIYSLFFDKWWKQIYTYDRIIVFDYFANPQILRRIKIKHKEVDLILWLWNTAPNNIEELKKYATVFCFDHVSCEKWKLRYNTQFYFSIPEKKYSVKVNDPIDIYFIGADKGRLKQLLSLSSEFENMGLKYKFEILSDSKESYNNSIVILKEPESYQKIIDNIGNAKCILEIVKEGQDGITLRALEALFFGKKLITNDKKIVDYNFYDKNNIFILNVDDTKHLFEFLKTPYKIIDKEVKEQYTYECWLNRMHSK